MHLARIMTEKGMNQVELAKRSGVSQGLISSYLRGGQAAKMPSIGNLIAIAKALRCTPNELLGWPEDQAIPDDIMKVAEKLASLPEGHWMRQALQELWEKSQQGESGKESQSD